MGIRPSLLIWVTESLGMLPRMIWRKFQRWHAESFSADFNTVGMTFLSFSLHSIKLLLTPTYPGRNSWQNFFFSCDNTYALDCSTTDEIQGLGSGSVNSWARGTSHHQIAVLERGFMVQSSSNLQKLNASYIISFCFLASDTVIQVIQKWSYKSP